jgi:hypothetical protein
MTNVHQPGFGNLLNAGWWLVESQDGGLQKVNMKFIKRRLQRPTFWPRVANTLFLLREVFHLLNICFNLATNGPI